MLPPLFLPDSWRRQALLVCLPVFDERSTDVLPELSASSINS